MHYEFTNDISLIIQAFPRPVITTCTLEASRLSSTSNLLVRFQTKCKQNSLSVSHSTRFYLLRRSRSKMDVVGGQPEFFQLLVGQTTGPGRRRIDIDLDLNGQGRSRGLGRSYDRKRSLWGVGGRRSWLLRGRCWVHVWTWWL